MNVVALRIDLKDKRLTYFSRYKIGAMIGGRGGIE